MTERRSTRVRRAKSVISMTERLRLETLTYIVASMLESCFVTCGVAGFLGQLARRPGKRARARHWRRRPDRGRGRTRRVIGGALVLAVGRELLHAGDAGDLVLDDLGDLPLDDLGRGPPVGRVHRDDGGIDVRVFAHRQPLQGEHAEDHQHQADDRREDGALDGCVGNPHDVLPAQPLGEDLHRHAVAQPLDALGHDRHRPAARRSGSRPVPGLRAPISTSRSTARPFCTRKTYCRPWRGLSASSGHHQHLAAGPLERHREEHAGLEQAGRRSGPSRSPSPRASPGPPASRC